MRRTEVLIGKWPLTCYEIRGLYLQLQAGLDIYTPSLAAVATITVASLEQHFRTTTRPALMLE
jgi:hypothetical protein